MNINNNKQLFLIESKYAEDIVWITTSKHEVVHVKTNTPNQLLKYNLQINTNKTEEVTIPNNNSQSDWIKCKILGNFIHTNTDIENGKTITINRHN